MGLRTTCYLTYLGSPLSCKQALSIAAALQSHYFQWTLISHRSFVLEQGYIDSLLTWFVCLMLNVRFLKRWGFVTVAASPFQYFLPAPTPLPHLYPLISFKTGTRNLVVALINNIKIRNYWNFSVISRSVSI